MAGRSSAGALFGDTVNWNLQWTQIKSNVGFWGEGKPEYLEETSRCRVENQQTQPTYDAESGNRTWATLVGGTCSHHCAISAPLMVVLSSLLGKDHKLVSEPLLSIKSFWNVKELSNCSKKVEDEGLRFCKRWPCSTYIWTDLTD